MFPSSSSVEFVKPSGSPVTSQARSNFLRASNHIVQLNLTAFRRSFFKDGPSLAKCKKYAPASVCNIAKANIPQQLEKHAYGPICDLLNAISQLYCDGEKVASHDRVSFIDHSSHPPCRHPHPYVDRLATQKPDILAIKVALALIWGRDVSNWSQASGARPKKPAIAWHNIVSAIEAKGAGDNQPLPQAATYAGSVMQSRPDLGGCFGLAVSAQFFQVVWSDSAAVYASPEISWDSNNVSEFLVNYVHFVHCPSVVDPTITLAAPDANHDDDSFFDWEEKSYATSPTWRVSDDQGNIYHVDYLLTIGEPWTRKNWVVRSTRYGPKDQPLPDLPCSPVIIKDSFLEDDRLGASSEGSLLDHVHGTDASPHRLKGVTTKILDFIVTNKADQRITSIHVPGILRNNRPIGRRTKYRVIFHGAAATSVYSCRSVLRFLMAMYDVLSVLRTLHEKYGLLHRDISPANILLFSEDISADDTDNTHYAEDQPVFISRLLAYNEEDAELKNQSTVLLIDFDNAALEDQDVCEWRTGTPAFIARQIASGKTSDESRAPKPIPELEGEARAAYVRIFGQQSYDDNSRLHDTLTAVQRITEYPKVVHRPWHDAESCYWNIVHFLILAMPLNADQQKDNTKAMSQIFDAIDTHQIGVKDRRNIIIELREDEWLDILHHDLQGLAPFLRDLQDCMKPDWTLIQPEKTHYNVHEAMQRLIMKEIWRLKDTDPIELNIEQRRVPPPVTTEGHSATRPTTSMKQSADFSQTLTTGARNSPGKKKSGSKRKRPTSSGGDVATSSQPQAKRARTKAADKKIDASSSAAGTSAAGAAQRKSTRIMEKLKKR